MSATLKIDPAIVPWSQRGSFMSLATKGGMNGTLTPGKDLYLITHTRQWALPIFAIRPLPAGQRLGPPSGFHTSDPFTSAVATPQSVRWKYGEETVVEATFQHVRCLRLTGCVPLAFDSDLKIDTDVCSAYIFQRPPIKGSFATIEYTYTSMKGYRFVATKGKLSHVNGNRPELCHKRIQIDPGVDGSHWELLICEVDVDSRPEQETMDTCAPLVQQALCASFGDAVSAFGSVFDDYCRQITPWSSGSPGDTEILAAYVMWTSTVRAGGHFTRESILMSKLWMNKIWSWDNCINALGVACLDIDLAVGQLMALYDHQAPDGRIPDSVDWLLVEWGFTKPPIHGWTLKKLLEDRVDIKPDDLKRLYHHTAKFTNFWLRERQTDVSKLPWYSHGNDSGWDNSTVFDNQSVVCGPDCAAFLILQCDLLAQLSQQLGDGTSETQMWTNAKESLVKALLEELWDGESFRFKDAITGETRKSSSLLRLVPLIASKYLPEIVVSKMADEISKHLTEWGLATEELDSQFYESDGYWRGPIWAPPTVLIESGLREGGFTKLADVISERYINLCEKSGFAENYDAVTGAGLRDLSYTWSASAYLHLKKELSVRNGLET